MINIGADPKITGALVYVAMVEGERYPLGVFSAIDLAATAVQKHPKYVKGNATILFHKVDEGPVLETL